MELENNNSSSSNNNNIIPERVLEGVTKTLSNIQQLQANFDEFLSLSTDPDVLSDLSPLDRATSLLLLAKTISLLLSVRLRCSGVYPDHHPIKGEMERISRYQEKLEHFVNLSKAPLKPSTKLNYQAATRFIEHSLPDLTSEQRQSMRAISSSREGRMKYSDNNVQKKRKIQSSETKSVREAAQEFLEKAARELLAENNGFKGPLAPVQRIDLDED